MKKLTTLDQIKDLTVAICITMADTATAYGDIADHFRSIGALCGENNFTLDQLQSVVADLQATVNLAMEQDIARRVADNQCPIESKLQCKSAYQGRLSDQIKKFLIPSYNEAQIEIKGESTKLAHFYRSDAGAAKVQSNPPKAKTPKTLTATGKPSPRLKGEVTQTERPAEDLKVLSVRVLDQVGQGAIALPEQMILDLLAKGLASGAYSLAAIVDVVDQHTANLAQADGEKVAKEIAALELVIAQDQMQKARANVRKIA